jgi:hypothetical protein
MCRLTAQLPIIQPAQNTQIQHKNSTNTKNKILNKHNDNNNNNVRREDIFLCSRTFRPALGPTQTPIQWVKGFFFQGKAAVA